jgi:hypothetical protein
MTPFAKIINCFIDCAVPYYIEKINHSKELTDEQFVELQDFIQLNLVSNMKWATSTGIIYAANCIVTCAINNGNIEMERNLPKVSNDGFINCQYCGCHTNANLRTCCTEGFKQDCCVRAAQKDKDHE